MAARRSRRTAALALLDAIFFPVRALFMMTEGRFGLSSLREERMRMVARLCRGRTLDIGCGPGNLFINDFIGPDRGIGVDVFPYPGVETVLEDAAHTRFADCSFDTVTLIAVGGHIPRSKRAAEFAEFARVLKPCGRLLVTEGEPVTQLLVHKWAAVYGRWRGEPDMDSVRGMKDDEEYCMPRTELLGYLNTPPLRFTSRHRFMWGLNNVYVAEKCPPPGT